MSEDTTRPTVRDLLGRLKRVALTPLENRIGPLDVRRRHARAVREIQSVTEAIETFERRWPAGGDRSGERPIFILSAGWRSGSTLLQRLVLSGGDALIWGEPYDHCDLVRRLADSLKGISADYPPESFFRRAQLSGDREYSGEWVANLYPEPRSLGRAHRDFFCTLYAEPARSAGFSRWGFKEVRLSADYARYLRWLFPEARLLLLYRNPYEAYRSYRRFRGWYDRWPDEPVLTPAQFGSRWRDLAGGFVEQSDVLGAHLVKFEQLRADGATVRAISDYTGMTLKPEVLEKRIAGRGEGTITPQKPSTSEIRALARQVEPLASRLGYAP